MKHVEAAIVWIVALACPAFAGARESVVKLDMPGSGAQGSAVLIGGGLALTAEHCQVSEGDSISVPIAASPVPVPIAVSPVSEPPKNGIDEARLIRIHGSVDCDSVTIGPVPVVGDAVTAYGFPHGVFENYSGRVIRVEPTYIECDFLVDSGASGGGLFNADDQLIGIASAKDPVWRTSLWIHTDSLMAAVPQRYTRETRVVVFSLAGCGPCKKLERDIESGKFPGFTFEIATYDSTIGAWDKPELYEEFTQECRPGRDISAPTFWVPGTGKYREGYDTPPGLLGWLGGIVKLIVRGPPPRIPHLGPGVISGKAKEDKHASLLKELATLKEEITTLKSHVEEFQDGGVIAKIKGVAVLKEDKKKLESSVSDLRSSLKGIKEGPLAALLSLIGGLITGGLHGWLPSSKRGAS